MSAPRAHRTPAASDAEQSRSVAVVARDLLASLRESACPANAAGMARYGISAAGLLGVKMPIVRSLARDGKKALGRDKHRHHELAALLWASGLHEARIMAALVDEPSLVTEAQADAWVAELDSWDVCDQLAINLLRKTPFAWDRAVAWTSAEPEFVKRAGFALGATLGVHEKTAEDSRFEALLECSVREADDERGGVKKAISWQMRQIGKRNAALNAAAISACERILAEKPDSKAARWVARDVLRELRSDAVRERVGLS